MHRCPTCGRRFRGTHDSCPGAGAGGGAGNAGGNDRPVQADPRPAPSVPGVRIVEPLGAGGSASMQPSSLSRSTNRRHSRPLSQSMFCDRSAPARWSMCAAGFSTPSAVGTNISQIPSPAETISALEQIRNSEGKSAILRTWATAAINDLRADVGRQRDEDGHLAHVHLLERRLETPQ